MDLGRWSQDDDRVRDIYLEEEGEGERGDHLELEWKLVSAACHCGAVGIHCVTDWALRWLGWRGVEIRRRRGEDGLGITGHLLRRWLMDASTLVGMLFVLKLSWEKEGFEGKFLLWLKSNDTPSAIKIIQWVLHTEKESCPKVIWCCFRYKCCKCMQYCTFAVILWQ